MMPVSVSHKGPSQLKKVGRRSALDRFWSWCPDLDRISPRSEANCRLTRALKRQLGRFSTGSLVCETGPRQAKNAQDSTKSPSSKPVLKSKFRILLRLTTRLAV